VIAPSVQDAPPLVRSIGAPAARGVVRPDGVRGRLPGRPVRLQREGDDHAQAVRSLGLGPTRRSFPGIHGSPPHGRMPFGTAGGGGCRASRRGAGARPMSGRMPSSGDRPALADGPERADSGAQGGAPTGPRPVRRGDDRAHDQASRNAVPRRKARRPTAVRWRAEGGLSHGTRRLGPPTAPDRPLAVPRRSPGTPGTRDEPTVGTCRFGGSGASAHGHAGGPRAPHRPTYLAASGGRGLRGRALPGLDARPGRELGAQPFGRPTDGRSCGTAGARPYASKRSRSATGHPFCAAISPWHREPGRICRWTGVLRWRSSPGSRIGFPSSGSGPTDRGRATETDHDHHVRGHMTPAAPSPSRGR
jgi:hypothetical protein